MFASLQEFAATARKADYTSREAAFAQNVLPDPARLIQLSGVEAMVRFSPALQDRSIRLNFFGTDVEPAEFLDEAGFYDFDEIARCHRGGATVVFNQCQWFAGAVFDLKRSLENVVGARVNINGYFTPPNAQGFHPHTDDHDVFIVQVAGAKEWTLSGVPPYRDGKFHTRNWTPAKETKVILNPGDVLYLPEGVAHWARTHGNETSVHLTCGYTPARWHHLFAGVAETSLQDELALLDRFPPEIAQNPDAFADEIQRRQALLGQDLGRAAELVLQRFADRTEHNARAQVSPSDTVDWTDPTLRLQVSKGVSQRVFGGELRLKNVPLGRSVTLFLKHRPMWIWMRQNPTFQPHELPGVLPPELKQLFCAYLLSNGLLRTVPTAAPDGESTA